MKEKPVRTLFLNMTMSLDGYIAGSNGELDWMTTTPDAELTADIVAQLRRADEGFIGYPTAEGMIRYWAGVAADPDTSPAARAIAEAVSGMHAFAVSRTPAQIDAPNAEVLVAPDDSTLAAAVTAIKQRPGRDLGLPRRRTHRPHVQPSRPHRRVRSAGRTGRAGHRAATVRVANHPEPDQRQEVRLRRHPPRLPTGSHHMRTAGPSRRSTRSTSPHNGRATTGGTSIRRGGRG